MSLTEHAGLVRDAIDSVLAGSKPWEIYQMHSVINNAPFSEEEKAALIAYIETAINQHKLDILKREMTKVLVGASEVSLGSVANEISSLGGSAVQKQQAQAGIYQQAFKQAEIERIKKEIDENNYKNYRNAAQQNTVQQKMPSFNDPSEIFNIAGQGVFGSKK